MALIKGKQLKDSAVVTAKIADGAITTAKITDANVTTAKLADDAVTAAKLASSAVVTASIADANVTTAKIANSAVTLAKLENLANLRLLGNVSGSAAAPAAIEIDTNISTVSNNDDTLASAKAIKSYVDSVATGLDVKKSVRVATTEFLYHSPSYNNGTNGVGATLTAGSNNAFYAIDGMGSAISVGERILVKNQGTPAQNGIYTLTTAGSASAAWVLTRATDADSASEVTPGLFTFVEEGTANGDAGYVLTSNGSITLGSTDLEFSKFTHRAVNLSSLTDVTLSSGVVGQVLTYNGSGWVNSHVEIAKDSTPQLGGNLDVNGNDIVSTSNGDIELDPNGSGVVVFKGNATKGSGQFKLNCENNSHGITIKGPPHSAAANYTLTLPDNDGDANQVLKTDGSGNLSWVANSGGGSSSTAYSEVVVPATGVSSGAYHLVHKSDAVTLNTSGTNHTALTNGTYVVVTANTGSVTRAQADAAFAGKSLNLTGSTAVAANDVLLIDSPSNLTDAALAGLTVAPIYTVANTTSGSASLSFNGLDQQLSTNITGFSFVAISVGGTAWASASDVTGTLTSGTHFLRYKYDTLSVSLETDDRLLISYIG